MEFGRAWKDLKASFRGLVSTVFKDNVDKPKKTSAFVENLKGTVVQAHESLDDGPGPWDNMVVKKPISSMEVFDEVLIDCTQTMHKLKMSFKKDDTDVKFNGTVVATSDVDGLTKMHVEGKTLSPGIYNMFFKIGNENDLGVNIKPHESMSYNSGIVRSFDDKKDYKNGIWTSAVYENTSALFKAKVALLDPLQSVVIKADVSGAYGRTFGNFGVLAGLDLAHNSRPDSNWRHMLRAVSLSVVCPVNATRLTVQPNDSLVTLENYWKINDLFKLAIRAKANYSTVTLPVGEIGVKYDKSENMEYGIKTDMKGNVMAGTWWTWPSHKIGLLVKSNVIQNIGVIDNIGLSVEF